MAMNCFLRPGVALFSVFLLSTAAGLPAEAADKKSPKLKADFTGVWVDKEGILASEAPAFNPFKGSTANGRNRPPLKPELQSQRDQARNEDRAIAAGAQKTDPAASPDRACPRGPTGSALGVMMANFSIEVMHTPGQMNVVSETTSRSRRIYTDGRGHPAPEDWTPHPMGHSTGHWEGDTLVVETIGLRPTDRGSLPISDQTRISERLRLVDENTLVDDIVVEDPVHLAEPWKFRMVYERLPQGSELIEYDCTQNNRNTVDLQILPPDQPIKHN